MRAARVLLPLSTVALLICVGCGSEDQLKKVEQEVGDMKLEVFKLRQQVEEANRKLDGERGSASESRAQDRRFQADLQETLRQLQDATRVLNNRIGNLSKPAAPRTGGSDPVPGASPLPPLSSESDEPHPVWVLGVDGSVTRELNASLPTPPCASAR